MNYQGTQLIHIYDRLQRPRGTSTKYMWAYLEHDDGRPRLLAKFGDEMYPVRRRANRNYIVVDHAPQKAASPRPETVEAAVAEMVARGKARRPALAKRLDSAEALVLGGKVALNGDTAKGGVYRVTADSCNCGDFIHRGGWCKHRLAVRMARHLAAHGFEVPTEETAPWPMVVEGAGRQISRANMALIASGEVVDAARRRELAYRESGQAARDRALRMLANGAKTLPADLARRAGVGRPTNTTGGD